MESSSQGSVHANRKENFTTEEIQSILFTETFRDTFGNLGAKEAYYDLLRLSKKDTELHLHGVSLLDYYRAKKIPKGFRINNIPTIGRNNPEFCRCWYHILARWTSSCW